MRMRKYIRRLAIGAFFTGLALTLSYPIAWHSVEKRNEQLRGSDYTSIEDARKDLVEEKALIGIGDYHKIDIEFDDNYPSAYYIPPSLYVIHRDASGEVSLESKSTIVLGEFRTRKAIKHELFHAEKSINGNPFGWLRRWYPFNYIEEWQATSYALEE